MPSRGALQQACLLRGSKTTRFHALPGGPGTLITRALAGLLPQLVALRRRPLLAVLGSGPENPLGIATPGFHQALRPLSRVATALLSSRRVITEPSL